LKVLLTAFDARGTKETGHVRFVPTSMTRRASRSMTSRNRAAWSRKRSVAEVELRESAGVHQDFGSLARAKERTGHDYLRLDQRGQSTGSSAEALRAIGCQRAEAVVFEAAGAALNRDCVTDEAEFHRPSRSLLLLDLFGGDRLMAVIFHWPMTCFQVAASVAWPWR
jgi:hypothetical protein